jgi:hypothetical protein
MGDGERFDLGVVGAGFGAHEGQPAVALVRRVADGAIVGNRISAPVHEGRFAFLWREALTAGAVAYDVVLYVGPSCVASEVWRLEVGSVTRDVVLEVSHDHASATPAACAAFDLYAVAFTGSGYYQHAGQAVRLAVVRTSDQFVAGGPAETTVLNGAVFVQLDGVLQPGFSYEVRYYADHNGSGACEPPPADHMWAVPFGPVVGDAVLNHSAGSDYTDVCPTFH